MDSISCTNLSHDYVLRINNDSNVVISNEPLPLGPVTPDSIKEIGEYPFSLNSSPLTGLDKPCKAICFDTYSINVNSTPRTPSNVVFDPFATKPEDISLDPQCKNSTTKPRLSASRRLDFDFSSNLDDLENKSNGTVFLSDDVMIELVYEDLLKVIISMQTKGRRGSDYDCGTPPLAPRVSGIAETCPGAPVKRAGKLRNVDLGLCRKLEF